MKLFLTSIFLLFALIASADYWTQKATFPGPGRQVPASFVINGKGYVSGGISPLLYLNDLWEYDPATNGWTQKADLPGAGRYGAVGFAINSKGYIGIGGTPYLNDFWEYDAPTDTWTQKADFGGPPRQRGG